MTRAQAAKVVDWGLADQRFYDGLQRGHRQPSYFAQARHGVEETRGVAFAPSPSRHRGPMRPGKTKRKRGGR